MKSNPGKLNYGAPAPSSANALEMQMFLAEPDKCRAGRLQRRRRAGDDRAAGRRSADDVRDVLVRGRFRKTGQRQNARGHLARANLALSDIPTMREQGFDMVVGSWQGYYAPRARPSPSSTSSSRSRPDDEEFRCREAAGRWRRGRGSQQVACEFRKFWEAEDQRFAKIIKAANIETE